MARVGREHRSGETNGVASPLVPGGEVRCRWPYAPPGRRLRVEALLTSTLLVALAEIGDKTQLLAIVLAARFRRPLPIIAGILAATLANHFLAALVGAEAAALLEGAWFRYLVAASFVGMAVWTLIPDRLDDAGQAPARFGAFLTTLAAFFMVEMGDKTQIATIALGARFHDLLAVTAGTTLGMMIANVPAVLLGARAIRLVPLGAVRAVTGAVFLLLGLGLAARTAGAF